jgi:hypothetical protein
MYRKTTHLVSFILAFAMAGSICPGTENYSLLQEEVVVVHNIAYNPKPPDGAIHSDTWAKLSWSPGRHAASHDVYIGKNFDDVNNGTNDTFCGNYKDPFNDPFVVIGFPNLSSQLIGLMMPGATIYWRVDEVNDLHSDSPWKGDVWSFTITPYTAYNPVPADEARFIDTDITLNWEAGFGAKVHHVYFGENFSDVNDGVDETYKGHAADTTYNPGQLQLGKIYYWRVDEFDGYTTHKGDVWSFTTKPYDPNLAYDPWPSDGFIHEDTWALLSWLPGRNAASHDVYFGDNFEDVNDGTDKAFHGNQLLPWYVVGFGTYIDMSGLIPGTTYYWRVDEVNDLHPDSPWKGNVWSFTTGTLFLMSQNPHN